MLAAPRPGVAEGLGGIGVSSDGGGAGGKGKGTGRPPAASGTVGNGVFFDVY